MGTVSPRLTRTLALIPVLASCVALAGWQFRLSALRADMFGTFIAPNTALCFILCGLSVVLQLAQSRVWQRMGTVLGACVMLFAAATLVEYIFSVDLGIDRVFFSHRLSDWTLPFPGRFALNSAVAFTCAGLSLVTLRLRGWALSELTAGLVLLVFYLSAVGFLYSASLLYSRVMSPYTAGLFGMLGAALLCGSRRQVFVGTLLSKRAGGIVFRRILLAIVVLMPLLGFLQINLERRGLITADFSTATFVIIAVTIFTALTLQTANVLNDLDRRRQATEDALIRTEKLAAAGRMAATVAHEINNPLEAITNLLFLLKSDGNPELSRQYIRMAEQELARVSGITRRTLAFYREDKKPNDMDLGQVADSVIELYAGKLAGVALDRSYEPGIQIHGSEGEVRQIITNLLSNAIDALVPGDRGRIQVKITRSGEAVTLTVVDNGSGIRDADMSRIFEAFFTTKQDIGNGLGLWVTKTLVEKNGGRIDLDTSTDATSHGTSFRLTFPAAANATPATPAIATSEASSRG